MEKKKLSVELRAYKKKFFLKNTQLAHVLDVSPQSIGRWLNGSVPNEDSQKKIFSLLERDFYRDNVVDLGEKILSDGVEEKNLIAEEKKFPETTWSVSRVKTWLDNPWDFYCKYIKGLKRASPWQDALDRGTVLHSYLELTSKGLGRDAVEKKILSDNEKNFSEGKNYLSEKGIADGFRVANKYLDEYGIESNGKILETEKNILWDLSTYLPNQSFTGFIDAVVQDDRGRIWLVDYKTFSNKPKFDNLRMELQANVYMYVMREVYGVDVHGFIYDCINPKEKITGRGYHFYKAKIPYNERIVEMVIENFLTTIEMILEHQDYTMYKESTYGTAFMTELFHGFEEENRIKITGVEEDE